MQLWQVLLLIHISSAIVGLLSGYAAIFLRKGSGWHGAAGTVFFVSMLTMSSTAVYIAATHRLNMLNFTVGLLTFYLVATAWRAAKRRDGATDAFDVVALLYIAGVTIAAYSFGFEAVASAKGTKHGMPAFIYFIFGTIALLCAVTDIRLLLRGSLAGRQRIVRHLWRMCLALLIATMSFYPGQAKNLPASLRESVFVFAPHILLIGSMIYWRIRMRNRKRPTATTGGGPVTPAADISVAA